MPRESASRLMRWLKGKMMKHVHGMISCREFEAFIADYLGDELPAAQTKVFEWHLKLCGECRDYLRAYECSARIGQAVLDTSNDELSPDVPEDLVRAVLDARRQAR